MSNVLTVQINDHLHYIGVNDRATQLFEGMWPLPNGVAYNSYLMTGTKNILLDTVRFNCADDFMDKLREVLGEDGKVDYLVVNHMEPDHSSGMKMVLDVFPDVQIIGNKKTLSFLENYYGIVKNTIEVKEGETLELGNRKLTFYMTPMVHWPESMVCYEEETKVLFSQDAFGGFGTLDGSIFDDQINFDDYYYDETVRYYTNIVGKYSNQVQAALKKLSGLAIDMICPVHGPIWRENPGKIISLYDSLSRQETIDGVVIIYASMYGNTERMAEQVARSLASEGVKNIRIRDISKTSLSYLLADTWKYRGIVLGSCTYNVHLYPLMSFLVHELKMQKMKNHILGIFGSYSWSGGALKELKEFAEGSGFDVCPTQIEVNGAPKQEDLEALNQLGKEMAEKLREAKGE